MKPAFSPRMALVALFAFTSAAQADFITGSINFSSGAGGGIILQDSAGNVFFTDLKQVWRVAPDGRMSVAVPNCCWT